MINFRKPFALKPDNRKILFIAGVTLILLSAAMMFYKVKEASARNYVVVATRSLPSGAVIGEDDLRIILVDLAEVENNYFTDKNQIIGNSVLKNISNGELVPLSAIGSVQNLRSVAMKLAMGRVPPELAVNDKIDIWWTDPESKIAQNLLTKINIAQVIQDGTGYTGTITLVVTIPPSQVGLLISAIGTQSIDVVKHEN
jgi:hypothetical protein